MTDKPSVENIKWDTDHIKIVGCTYGGECSLCEMQCPFFSKQEATNE
jgi:hypothetical protein